MAKKSINLFLLILCIHFSFAQQTFEKLIAKPEDQEISTVVEDDSGNFVMVGSIYDIATEGYRGYIIKIDCDGNLIQEKVIQQADTGSCMFFNIHSFNSNYYIIGSIKVDSISDRLWYLKLNSNLEIENENILNAPDDRHLAYVYSILDTDSNFVVTGYTQRKYMNSPNFDAYFYKISLDGDSITSKFFTVPTLLLSYAIIESQDHSKYYAFGWGFTDIFETQGQRWSLDKDLNSLSFDSIPLDVNGYFSPTYLNETDLLLCGKGSPPTSELYALNVLTINEQAGLLNYNYFKKEDNMREHPALQKGVSKNGENIFVGGTSNFSYYTPYFGNMDSWFHLIKINSDITPQWEYWYGGDAYYVLFSILATNDGGCLMIGTRYDYETQSRERDIYITKVNSEGLIVWTQEIAVNKYPSIVYPNPGTNSLHVKTYQREWLVELFNLNGQLIVNQQVNADNNTINTQMLNPGIYFYKLIDLKNKSIESGKWVKL